jgi:hypothetical protein
MAMEAPAMATDTSGMNEKARRRHYEVEDALHTLRRAGEIVGDKKLMAEVKVMATERADEMGTIAKRAGALAKSGKISPKAMKKLAAK